MFYMDNLIEKAIFQIQSDFPVYSQHQIKINSEKYFCKRLEWMNRSVRPKAAGSGTTQDPAPCWVTAPTGEHEN